jgi:hypothetical protein
MNLEDQVPVSLLHVLEADISQDAGVVDEDIDAAKGIDGSLDDGFAILDRIVVGDGLAACRADLVDDLVGGLCAYCQRYCDGYVARRRVIACDSVKCGVERTAEPAPSPLKLPPRSLTTTLAPRLPKKMAYSRPRPPPAPVTTTVWPSYRRSCAAMLGI